VPWANIDPDGWKVDTRVNELLETLVSAGIEVVVDKMQPPLQLMEALMIDDEGKDSRLAQARSKIVWEVLTDEMLSTCAAVLVCVRASCRSNPGLRYVSGAAEAVRMQMTIDSFDVRENEINLLERRLPLKILFLVTDTGDAEDPRVSRSLNATETLEDIRYDSAYTILFIVLLNVYLCLNIYIFIIFSRYDGWVRDALAPKRKIAELVKRTQAVAAVPLVDNPMDYHDILYEEEGSKEEELALPLWANEHIEATAMYIKQALH
jgi:hypothetical protein